MFSAHIVCCPNVLKVSAFSESRHQAQASKFNKNQALYVQDIFIKRGGLRSQSYGY
jgi:hypothetical protein